MNNNKKVLNGLFSLIIVLSGFNFVPVQGMSSDAWKQTKTFIKKNSTPLAITGVVALGTAVWYFYGAPKSETNPEKTIVPKTPILEKQIEVLPKHETPTLVVLPKVVLTEEEKKNLELEIKIDEPWEKDGMLTKKVTLWFYNQNTASKHAILSHPRLKKFNINSDNPDEESFSFYKQLSLGRGTNSLGIGQATLTICEHIPHQHQRPIVRFNDMPYTKEIEQLLKNTSDFAILNTFETYSQHGGKGYGQLFFKKLIHHLQEKYPHLTVLIFIAVSLIGYQNTLESPKLYEFYQRCGAQQIKENDIYFYYDLKNTKQ